jgi:Fe-S-cluster containining protein
MTDSLPPAASKELEAVYQELDSQVRALGVACWARGDCCDFERCDHRLYASTVEIAYVLEKRAETLTAGGPGSAKLCPFWKEGKCTERERRPLGCRTFFCDRRYREPLEALYENYHRRLRELAERHALEWRYLPFVDAVRSAAPAGLQDETL